MAPQARGAKRLRRPLLTSTIVITTELSNAEYHAAAGVSSSLVKSFCLASPLAAWERYVSPTRVKELPSRAMFLGTMVHTLVLEPDKFKEEYPAFDASPSELPTLKTGKMRPKTWQEIFTQAHRTADAVKRHAMAKGVLYPTEGDAVYESSFIEKDPKTGMTIKCRPDMIAPGRWFADLKTTSTPVGSGFPYQARSLGYDLQEAFYRHVLKQEEGWEPPGCYFVVVETLPPHDVVVYQLTQDLLAHAETRVACALPRISDCFKLSGQWPGFAPNTIKPLSW